MCHLAVRRRIDLRPLSVVLHVPYFCHCHPSCFFVWSFLFRVILMVWIGQVTAPGNPGMGDYRHSLDTLRCLQLMLSGSLLVRHPGKAHICGWARALACKPSSDLHLGCEEAGKGFHGNSPTHSLQFSVFPSGSRLPTRGLTRTTAVTLSVPAP